jgi:hypothetical protein
VRSGDDFYGCPVEFGALSDLFEFSNDTLAIPLFTAVPKLLKALEPFCEMAAKERSGCLNCQLSHQFYKNCDANV